MTTQPALLSELQIAQLDAEQVIKRAELSGVEASMRQYLPEIAWETEVWVGDAPGHPIHLNGERFLGPMRVENREA